MFGTSSATRDRSNEQADVARRIIELSGTIAEAVEYMRDKLASMDEDAISYAGMLKDIGEGLVSLENAVSSVSDSLIEDPEDAMRLAAEYGELTERLNDMVDAYLEGRVSDLTALGETLRESFFTYNGSLSRCFRSMSIM
jgi:response regulator RpfG family c-di-GMP phosphodiesterase